MASIDSALGSLSLHRPQPHRIIPDLDADVMESVCSSIDDIYDLLSVSLTSSAMRRIAIRQLLRTHTIHLKTRRAIRDFRVFILNQKQTRAQAVHSIVIPEVAWMVEDDVPSPNDVDHLMDILDCTVNIGSLDISLGTVYADPARISSAFAGMSVLRYLSIADPGLRWALHALSALHSPLRTLCVGVGTITHTFFPSPSPPWNGFFQTISRFSTSSTLTTLLLDRIPMHDNSFVDFPQFRFVRSLSIIKPLEHAPGLDALLYLFPSLDGTLRLRMDFTTRVRLFMTPRPIEIRDENMRAQDVSRWTRIDRLDCDHEIANMLALQCPVRHFTVDSFDLKAIITIQPKHLVVTCIRLPFYFSPSMPHTPTLPASPCPTHITLIMPFNSREYPKGEMPCHWFVNYGWTRPSSITHARLVLHCYNEDPCGKEMADFMHEMYERTSPSVASQLVPASKLLAACPKLRYFFVATAGCDNTLSTIPAQRRWIRDCVWRVVELVGEGDRLGDSSAESASPTLEELSEHAARRVIEAEDLGLPEEWERKLEACRI